MRGEAKGEGEGEVECGGQSIIKPALSLPSGIPGRRKKKGRKKKEGGGCLRTDYRGEIAGLIPYTYRFFFNVQTRSRYTITIIHKERKRHSNSARKNKREEKNKTVSESAGGKRTTGRRDDGVRGSGRDRSH